MAAILLDIDGVLHVSGEAIAGAGEAVRALRADGHRLQFVTNNTTRARERLAEELRAAGIGVQAAEVSTTAVAAAGLLAGRRVLALTMAAVRDDLVAHVELVEDGADVVLVGGADESDESGRVFSYENLNGAFAALESGASLVCLHRNRWWQTSRGPLLDSGAFVAGLEYAAGVEAQVVGKPSRAYFEGALAELGAAPSQAVMVGDDVEADVGGAKAAGLRASRVRTGKFRERTLAAACVVADAHVDCPLHRRGDAGRRGGVPRADARAHGARRSQGRGGDPRPLPGRPPRGRLVRAGSERRGRLRRGARAPAPPARAL